MADIKITSPYNFVPLAPKVYIPKWGKDVSMDIPFEDGEDGIITIAIENVSPLFVRDGHPKTEDDSNRTDPNDERNYSAHVNVDGQYRYFIPGTTIKGCIRNVLEVLSFAKMTNYDNDSFGFRSFDDDNYKEAMEDVEVGWLKKSGEDYVLSPCKAPVQIVSHDDIQNILGFSNFDKGENHKTAERKQKSVKRGEDWYPQIEISGNELAGVPAGTYRLVCTGYMDGKKHEYLFPESKDEGDSVLLSDAVVKQFDSVHRHTEYYRNGEKKGFLLRRLENDEKIPVFFKRSLDGSIDSIGITRNYRYPYKNTVDKVRQNAQADVEGRDLAEIMFGFAEENDSLKGRIHVGHAFTERTIERDECIPVTGVLSEPKPSFYPQYLLQERGSSFEDYSCANAKIAGRKRYRIHTGETVTELNYNSKNPDVNTTFRPLPARTKFTAQITVHNLRGIEVGALLSALTFNQTNGTFHNIGMAKAYGYGKCSISITRIEGFSKSINQFLHEFEAEMDSFCKKNLDHKLTEEKSISQLLAIASEHQDAVLVPMDMKVCNNVKKIKKINDELPKEEPQRLMPHEAQRTVEQRVQEYQAEIDVIMTNASKDLPSALKKLNQLKDRLSAQMLPIEVVQSAIDRLLKPTTEEVTGIITSELPLAEDVSYSRISNPKTFIGRCKKRSSEVNTPEGLAIAETWFERFFEKATSRDKKSFGEAAKWKDLPIEEAVIKEWIQKYKK